LRKGRVGEGLSFGSVGEVVRELDGEEEGDGSDLGGISESELTGAGGGGKRVETSGAETGEGEEMAWCVKIFATKSIDLGEEVANLGLDDALLGLFFAESADGLEGMLITGAEGEFLRVIGLKVVVLGLIDFFVTTVGPTMLLLFLGLLEGDDFDEAGADLLGACVTVLGGGGIEADEIPRVVLARPLTIRF
jgi:hypothetical protein